jgi:hypothetical protein
MKQPGKVQAQLPDSEAAATKFAGSSVRRAQRLLDAHAVQP